MNFDTYTMNPNSKSFVSHSKINEEQKQFARDPEIKKENISQLKQLLKDIKLKQLLIDRKSI